MTLPEITAPIAGARVLPQLPALLASARLTVTDDEAAALSAAG